MENQLVITIVSVVIAALSLLFALYKHFSTRKIARLAYEVSQLSDYDVPESFLQGVTRALVVIRVESTGNKLAENVVLRVKTRSKIVDHEIHPNEFNATVSEQEIATTAEKLNPAQHLRILLYCEGRAVDDQIESIELTHAEGVGINKRSSAFTSVKFDFFGIGLEFDLLSRSLALKRFGPWTFK